MIEKVNVIQATDTSDLVKKLIQRKIVEIKKKIPGHGTCTITPKSFKLIEEHFDERLEKSKLSK